MVDGKDIGVMSSIWQFCSSDWSEQWTVPSHFQCVGIQNPSGHWKPQTIPVFSQLFSSDWSEHCGVPSHLNCEDMQ